MFYDQACNEFFRECFEKEDGSIELIHEVISGAGAGFCQGRVRVRVRIRSSIVCTMN